MFRLSDRFGEVQMRCDTKVRTADDDKRDNILRVDIVHDVDFMNIARSGRRIICLMLLLFDSVRRTLITVVLDEVNIID